MTSGAWYDADDEEDSPVTRRYCPWCGIEAVVGRPFCSSCGKSMSGAAGPTIAARLGSGVKRVGGWIGAAIMGVFFLFIVASGFMSEIRLWKDVASFVTGGEAAAPDAGCKGFSAWHDVSKKRFSRVEEFFKESEKAKTYTSAIGVSDQIFALAREQERSNPPAAATEYNRNMVALIDLSAKGIRARADADYAEISQVVAQLDLLNQSSKGVEDATLERCG